jgi:hypothetical protein
MFKETFQKKYNVVFLVKMFLYNNYLIDITGWHLQLKIVDVHAKSSDTCIVIVVKIGN